MWILELSEWLANFLYTADKITSTGGGKHRLAKAKVLLLFIQCSQQKVETLPYTGHPLQDMIITESFSWKTFLLDNPGSTNKL